MCELLPQPVPTSALKLGDAVVAFSRRDVLMLRDQIAAAGHPVSVIYGALPPEVRRREAERFAEGASHILVATDAIGMGLNLPIRRVLFSTMSKFDGVTDRPLGESEVHQIAGRAGRYGIHEEGFVGVLKEAEPSALHTLMELLPKAPRAPRDFKAPVAPNPWHVQTIASRLNLTKLRDVLGVFVEQLKLDDAHFAVAELDQMLRTRRAARRQRGQAFTERALHLRAGAGGHPHRHATAGLPRLDQQPRPHRPGRLAVVPRRRSTATAASSDGAGAACVHAVAVAGPALPRRLRPCRRGAGAAQRSSTTASSGS